MITIKPITGLIFLCGQCPVLPDNTPLIGSVTEKTHLMCQNTQAALEAAGSSLDKVIKVQVSISHSIRDGTLHSYLRLHFLCSCSCYACAVRKKPANLPASQIFFTDVADYEESNKVYVQYFPHIPARSAMEVSKIPPKGTTMQLDVIALKD